MRRCRGLALAIACGSLGAGLASAQESPGTICGDPAIVGETIPAIEGEGPCGVTRPVRVQSVAGVALEPQPTITCETARTLAAWVEQAVEPAFAGLGERLEAMHVAADYTCRNVNRARTGRLSEHAFGRAIDISIFRLADGEEVSIASGWSSERLGPLLRRIHAAACGHFTTTIGPGADGFHEDHLHYDIASRRRPYCH